MLVKWMKEKKMTPTLHLHKIQDIKNDKSGKQNFNPFMGNGSKMLCQDSEELLKESQDH